MNDTEQAKQPDHTSSKKHHSININVNTSGGSIPELPTTTKDVTMKDQVADDLSGDHKAKSVNMRDDNFKQRDNTDIESPNPSHHS